MVHTQNLHGTLRGDILLFCPFTVFALWRLSILEQELKVVYLVVGTENTSSMPTDGEVQSLGFVSFVNTENSCSLSLLLERQKWRKEGKGK